MNHVRNVACRRIVWSIGLAAVYGIPALAADPAPPGTLSGTLVDASGKPVAGARVWTQTRDATTSTRKALTEARSDAAGRFRLGPFEPMYRALRSGLRIEAEGFAGQCISSTTISVFPGSDNDLGVIRLDRGRVFTGTVIGPDGKPLAEALVSAQSLWLQHGHTLGGEVSDRQIRTDAHGRFRTRPLPVGHLSVVVVFPGCQITYFRRETIAPGGEQDLGEVQLEKEVPVTGVVQETDGKPIAGVRIGGTAGHSAITDVEGRFTLHRLGPDPSFQMNVDKSGYAPLIGRVNGTSAGLRYSVSRGRPAQAEMPAKQLTVILERAGWIEGRAIDADTGEPVRLDRVVVCNFERKPNGEVVLRGCQSDFEQTQPGQFRATFPTPDEYHLTFSAAGYHDAEAYTPKVTELKTIDGIVAKMSKKKDGSAPPIVPQVISGVVTRSGQPVRSGWVGLWEVRRTRNAPNAYVARGRTVVGDPITRASALIRDGAYRLSVPYQSESWYVVVEEPGQPLTQVGPISIALKEQKSVSIDCTEGCQIRGRVTGIPVGWEGHVWVVAFGKAAISAEVRVDATGQFVLPALPPGEYGLKAGHDGYDDAETYPGDLLLLRQHPEAFKQNADPWKRAKRVTLAPGHDHAIVEIEFPK
jgi:hypothetical protein